MGQRKAGQGRQPADRLEALCAFLRISAYLLVVWVSFPRPASSWRRHDARQKPAKRRHGAIPSPSGASPAQGDPPSSHWGRIRRPTAAERKNYESPKRRGGEGLAKGSAGSRKAIHFKVGLFASRSAARLDGNGSILSNLGLIRRFGFARARGRALLRKVGANKGGFAWDARPNRRFSQATQRTTTNRGAPQAPPGSNQNK